MMNKLILEYDDLHWDKGVDCLDIAEKLIKRFPVIIINFFTVANFNNQPIWLNKDWCKRLRKHIDNGNIKLAIHGETHSHLEFQNLRYYEAKEAIYNAEKTLEEAELPYLKVFRPPYWSMNEHTCEALIALNYTHLYSHINFSSITTKFKDKINICHYNWNLKDNFGIFENEPINNIIVAHGHTSNVCLNGIEESYNRLCEALENNNFEFLGADYYEPTA